MSKQLYIFSTLTSPNLYVNHATDSGNDLPAPIGDGVLIHGGAGLIDNHGIHTPRGVATSVTEQQVEYLRANKVFQLHEKNGFVVVSDSKVDANIAAADMASRDGSAPLVPEDLSAEEQPVVSTDNPTLTAEASNSRPVKRGK